VDTSPTLADCIWFNALVGGWNTMHYELHEMDADARLAWSRDEFELLLCVVAIVRLGGIPLAAWELAWELGEEPLCGLFPQ
jgi:hypothetical protein